MESESDSGLPEAIEEADLQIRLAGPMATDPTPDENNGVSDPRSLKIGTRPLTSHIEYRPDNSGPPDVWDLVYVQQLPGESIRQLCARFLSVKDKISNYLEFDIITAFK